MRAKRNSRLLSTLARWTSPALAVAIGLYFGAQGPAYSQIESRKISPPSVASSSLPSIGKLSSDKPVKPKAPAQVELSPPPPIKYFPGLEEPLVATGSVTDAESKDLDVALKAFHDAPAKAGPEGDYDDYAKSLIAFINAHPNSNWNSAINLDLGLGYYHSGYYSRSFGYLETAWQTGRNATNPMARLMVDRAVAELARMHASVGHEKELDAVLKDVGKRPVGGVAVQILQNARWGLWTFRHDPGEGYLCGPQALKNVLVALKADKKQIKIADDARSGPHGFSLTELAKLADRTTLKYTLIHRDAGQPIPVPSVINWNVHHYAAVTGKQGAAYWVADPTFADTGSKVLTTKAIDAESSGYFLVPAQVMKANPKAGWRVIAANSAEAKAVYGMGDPSSKTPANRPTSPNSCHGTNNTGSASNGQPPYMGSSNTSGTHPPMCTASAMLISAGLSLTDVPVGYAPQVGPSAYTEIFYNAADEMQPATFSFSNLSPQWTHTWQAYVTDDPVHAYSSVTRYVSGGSGNLYNMGYNGSTGQFAGDLDDNSQMFRVPASGSVTSYTRTMPDGGTETFAQSDGATSYPRRMFLTKVTDPQGNSLTINYDSSLRVTSITDAMGRSTTFTYGLTAYPLLITQVTDPFGRSTQLTYDTSQRLISITDPVGITSSFTYSATEPTFVTSLTTPYGTTNFNNIPNPNDPVESLTSSLTITDPLGYTEFVYFYLNPSITPSTVPSAEIPSGMNTDNGLLQWRNTYYWDKHAAALGVTMTGGQVTAEDYTKAVIYHWCHDGTVLTALGSTQCSIQRPLENRIFYGWPNQGYSYAQGTLNRPAVIGRVLDSGASQFFKYTYNALGNRYIFVDPLNRGNYNYYAANSQDMTGDYNAYGYKSQWGSYTSAHRPQTYTDASYKVWHLAWNTAGQISTLTDPNSNVTTWNYDASGRLSNIVNALSNTQVSYTYDSADRVQTKTDSEGYVLTYTYDNIDRVTSITYPDGTTDLYDYTFQSGPYAGTPSLELRKHTDRLGRVTTYGYDADQRLTSVTEPTQGSSTRTTSYDYYENGVLKDITDANGNVTHWDIDIESRPIHKIYAYGTASAKTETYTYENTTSRLKSITDALGQVKTFTYDNADEPTGITYTSTVNPTPNVTFTWDTYLPRITKMTDGTGTTTYNYTAIGTNGGMKLSSIVGPYTNDTVGLTYDALSRLSGRTITGGNETFGYDALSRLTSHGTPLGTFTDTYLGQTSQMTGQSVTNSSTTVSTNWSYDTNTNDRRLIGITNSGVTRGYALSYLNGSTQNPYDIQSITDTAASGHPWATQTHSYSYDLIDRLLTANAIAPGNFSYTYDALDNATTVTTPSGTVTPAPTYNGFNQLSTWASNSYSYDANGNTVSGDGVKTYKWDAENRLIEIDYTGTSNKTTFAYDGIGHRTVQADTISGTTTTTHYLWCPERQRLSNSGLNEADAYEGMKNLDSLIPDGITQAEGGFLCQKRDGSDNVLRRDLPEGEYNVSGGQKLVYMPDQLNSVRDVLDATTGNLVQSYDYTPYGAVARSSGSTPTDFQYAELFYHPVSGLNLATYRAMDGVTGRFMNRDPNGEDGGINLYGYSGANPTNFNDPSGLCDGSCPLYEILFCTKEHTKGARPSTQGDHEKGQKRRNTDYGGEKGDENRPQYPRRPPGGKTPKGGWPPKSNN